MPSWQAKGYWVMLVVTLTFALGSFVILWINLIFDPKYFLENPLAALGWSLGCLISGALCLFCFSVYFEDRGTCPWEKNPDPESL